MTPREIHSVMRRLFGHEVHGPDDWRHLVANGTFDRELCRKLLDDYIESDLLLVHGGTVATSFECSKDEAVAHAEALYVSNVVRLADRDLSGRVIIQSIGVGKGSTSLQREG
jgi:hypothetical protein